MLYVVGWVLASVLAGLLIGFYLGRSALVGQYRELARCERETTLKTMLAVLHSAQQLSSDVDSHSHEISRVGRHVGDLKVSGELEEVQHMLLGQISGMLDANRRLEEDLRYTQYRVEEQAQEIDRTRAEARTDVLSGVANRQALGEKLDYLVTNWRKTGEPFVLILADVDHFKWINDTHGHPAGDRVVTHLGQTLRSLLRLGDFVGRYGGDEFALLLPKTEPDVGERFAEQLRQSVARCNFDVGHGSERVAVTLSIGVTAIRAGDTVERVIARADRALYKAKHSGRNTLAALFEAEELAGAGV
jgi:diguanylate cyclase